MTEEEVIEKIIQRKEGFFERNKAYIIGAVLLIVGGWYMFGIWSDLSDNRARVESVTKQLDATRDELQKSANQLERIDKRLDGSINTVIRTERTIETVKDRTQADTRIINESAKLISDSERIIQDIRKRGAIETGKTQN